MAQAKIEQLMDRPTILKEVIKKEQIIKLFENVAELAGEVYYLVEIVIEQKKQLEKQKKQFICLENNIDKLKKIKGDL